MYKLLIKVIIENISPPIIAGCIVSFIAVYVIYYFDKISAPPILIGSRESPFVASIRAQLSEDNIIGRRFSPVIYLWGTRFQSLLFRFLQGRSSIYEMPRSEFTRQYVYVSDAQYLYSNIDLSEHYKSKPVKLIEDDDSKESFTRLTNVISDTITNNKRCLKDPIFPIRRKWEKLLQVSDETKKQTNDKTESIIQHPQEQLVNELETQHIPDKCDCGILLYRSCYSHDTRKNYPHHPLYNNDNHHHQKHKTQRELLEFGCCALDWYRSSHKNYHENNLVALISPGLSSGSDKKYVTDTVSTLVGLGYEVCVFIRRGVCGLKLSSSKYFSLAKWGDFQAAIVSIKRQRPRARLVSIGFCLGSIELCRYLAMSGKESLVDFALLFSCPFDPIAGVEHMKKRSWMYASLDTYTAKNLERQLRDVMFNGETEGGDSGTNEIYDDVRLVVHNKTLLNDLAAKPRVRVMADFELNYNRILDKYPSIEAYAQDCQLQDQLSFIETLTLCINSEDDFLAPIELLPLDEIKRNKNLCMLLVKKGGHMAFVDGLLWPKKPYFAQRVISSALKRIIQ